MMPFPSSIVPHCSPSSCHSLVIFHSPQSGRNMFSLLIKPTNWDISWTKVLHPKLIFLPRAPKLRMSSKSTSCQGTSQAWQSYPLSHFIGVFSCRTFWAHQFVPFLNIIHDSNPLCSSIVLVIQIQPLSNFSTCHPLFHSLGSSIVQFHEFIHCFISSSSNVQLL
jgi:hypothetical protein